MLFVMANLNKTCKEKSELVWRVSNTDQRMWCIA